MTSPEMAIGENKQYVWDYSEASDILNIHKKNIKTAGSAELGDITIDFDQQGDVVGLEMVNISDFLQPVGIRSAELTTAKDVQLLIRPGKSVVYLWLKLMLAGNIEKTLSIPAPVLTA